MAARDEVGKDTTRVWVRRRLSAWKVDKIKLWKDEDEKRSWWMWSGCRIRGSGDRDKR